MRVLVTGANGFVGRATVRALAGSGAAVRALVRSSPHSVTGAVVLRADLSEEQDFGRIVRGVDAVIHLAARVHVMHETERNPLEAFRAANVEPTRRLAEAAAAAGVARFVFVSTLKVHGERTRGAPFTSDGPLQPEDDYGRSKAEAEACLADVAAVSGIQLAIIRPPLIYGPGVRGNFIRLLDLVDRGWPLPFGGIDNRRSLLYVENLADLLARVSLRDEFQPGAFLVADRTPVSTPELIRRIADAMNRSARLWPCPSALLRTAGRLSGFGPAIDRLLDSLEVDPTQTERVHDWVPPFGMEEGLKRTAEWYRAVRA
jgi:nucleoside-diphosphate-sugar epimerase